MKSEYTNVPRVLVLSGPPLAKVGATGVTLSNLFTGWPRDKLAQIFGDPVQPDPSICLHSYYLSGDQAATIRAMKSLRAWIYGMSRGEERSGENKHGIAGGAVKGSVLASLADGLPYRIPQDLVKWVEDFDPQVIYSPLGSIRMMSIALQLSQRFDIPVVPHFMDDWPRTVYATGAWYSPLRVMLRSNLGKVLSRAPVGLTICDDMSNEYALRHDMRFEAFMNCVDVHEREAGVARRAGGEVVFGYVGGLHLNRWKSLRDVAAALQVAKNEGSLVRLDIFAPEADVRAYRSEFDGFAVVGKMDTLGYSDVRERLGNCDVLVHVESFLPADSRYTRLSISTKIPQYMAAERPILAYGPDTLSSIAYVARTGAGLAITKEGDVPGLLRDARRLIEQPALRVQLGQAGRNTASERHDASCERQRLMVLMGEAAIKWRRRA